MNKLSEQTRDATEENSTTPVLETVEFMETVDLSPLAESSRFLEIELPSFHQKLLELQARKTPVTIKDIRVNLTNPNGKSFGGSNSNDHDWFMLERCIGNKDVRISRVTFRAVSFPPFWNTIVVYFYYHDDSEKSDSIGHINWNQVDKLLWPSYWNQGVTLSYSVDIENGEAIAN